MKRIVPPALLALAALVVLPTKTLPTTSRGLSRLPVGIDRAALGSAPNALDPNALDDGDSPLIAGAPIIMPVPEGEPANALARPSHDKEEAALLHDPAPRSADKPAKADGTTPRVAVAAAGSPITPTSESTTIAWVTPTGFIVLPGKELAPRQVYAGLIEPAHLEREEHCLAQAVYFEARSEVEEGRAAVAQVVLNRVKSGVYPTTVCGVVFQNRHRKLACQFTFACEGKALRVTEPEAWKAALRIARGVYEGTIYLTEVGAATHYHADYVQPTWAKRLKKMDVIGRHIFYS